MLARHFASRAFLAWPARPAAYGCGICDVWRMDSFHDKARRHRGGRRLRVGRDVCPDRQKVVRSPGTLRLAGSAETPHAADSAAWRHCDRSRNCRRSALVDSLHRNSRITALHCGGPDLHCRSDRRCPRALCRSSAHSASNCRGDVVVWLRTLGNPGQRRGGSPRVVCARCRHCERIELPGRCGWSGKRRCWNYRRHLRAASVARGRSARARRGMDSSRSLRRFFVFQLPARPNFSWRFRQHCARPLR